MGISLNPVLDIGQVEGGFIQGMGWLTMEKLVWHPTTGMPTTHAPSTYKIPTANDCPPEMNVRLFGAPNASETIHRSKAVGDPPLRAPATAAAVLDAIDAVRYRLG